MGPWIWVSGHGIYHGLGPGNTTPVYPPVLPTYPGYTPPPATHVAVHGSTGYEALLNA